MQTMIEKELTIVLQGRVNSYTHKSINSILQNFPLCENIIISTWQEDYIFANKLKSLDNEKISLIFSEDPGAEVRRTIPKEFHNINRILISSKMGLDQVKSDYVLLIRSDLLFSSSKILFFYQKYNDDDRILILNHTTIDDNRDFRLLFHCCEWLHLARTSTLKSYFNIDLMPREFMNWYSNHSKPEDRIDPGNLSRFMAEDYITSKGLQNLGYKISHEYYCHYDKNISENWHQILGGKYIVLSCRQLGIINLKYPISTLIGNSKSLSFVQWKKYAQLRSGYLERSLDKIRYFSLSFLYKLRRLIKSLNRVKMIYFT